MNGMITFMRYSTLAVLVLLSLSPSVAAAQPADSTESARLKQAVTIFNEIMSAEDKSIPQMILGKAEAIAIFPSTIKGGFVVGGMRGRGVISARTASGWSAPAFMTLTGGSIGLQIGRRLRVTTDRSGSHRGIGPQLELIAHQ
jgi:lipid-binding SYLF domain-containing protein